MLYTIFLFIGQAVRMAMVGLGIYWLARGTR